jgi:hypothetical protein
MAEFRKATNDLKNTISTELTVEEAQPARPRRVDLASVAPAFGSPAARQSPAETVPYAAEVPAPAPEAAEAVASAHEAAPAVPPAAPEIAPPADPELAEPIQPS